MKEKFTILIAERNRNIREFLKREMIAEGYLVQSAKNGREVLTMIDLEYTDLLILDLDMPYLDGIEILEQLQNKNQSIPIIVHSFLKGNENHMAPQKIAAFVEKNGKSVNGLKTLVSEALKKYYPLRFNRTFGMMSSNGGLK